MTWSDMSCAFSYRGQYKASLYSVGVLQETDLLLIKVKANCRSLNRIAII